MKKLLILLFVTTLFNVNAQYSSYYKVDVNSYSKVNVDANVKVDKTIKTIDYGALARANAERERNKINLLKINNEKEREAMTAIAINPSVAIDYGETMQVRVPQDVRKIVKDGYGWGYKSFIWGIRMPHKSLFKIVKSDKPGFKFENISDEGISTVIQLGGQHNVENRIKKYKCSKQENSSGCEEKNNFLKQVKSKNNLKEYVLKKRNLEGNVKDDIFYHKVVVGKATVQGAEGFKVTSVIEDDFEKAIIQDFYSSDGTIVILASSKVSADKNVLFEDIEGRNYYLTPIIEKVISSAFFTKPKL